MKRLIEDLPVSNNEMMEWANGYYDWLTFNTRPVVPLAINSDNYLVKAHYHTETGRGGYFAPESGTSEGQFLTLLGALEMYETTKELKWLGQAEKLAQSALDNLYAGQQFPTKEFDESNIFAPHWLFNAESQSFTAENYYLQDKVSFKNGVGTLKKLYDARKIFSVRALDAELVWENPFSEIIGESYEVKEFTTEDKTFTITLVKDYTGDLLVCSSDMGGPQIEPGENYEAWPIWRKLGDRETSCAVDSLWWSYDCWQRLYQFTGNEKYKILVENLKGFIKYACSLANANDYITINTKNTNPLDGVGNFFVGDLRYPKNAEISRNKYGETVLDIPEGVGTVQTGKGGIDEPISDDRHYLLRLAAKNTTKVSIIASDAKGYDPTREWSATVRVNGGSKKQNFDLKQEDFLRTENILWDLFYNPLKENIYTSDNSSVALSEELDSSNREYRKVSFTRGSEKSWDGYYFLGWAQYHPSLQNEWLDELPPFTYKSSGSLEVRFVDEDGWRWVYPLASSKTFKTVTLDKSKFFLYETQNNYGTLPTKPKGKLTEMLFEAVSKSATLWLKTIGEVETLPKGFNLEKMVISYEDTAANQITIDYLRPTPIEGYEYSPWVAPFTVNMVNGGLDDWRGTPYSGYQCPWIWQELDEPTGVDVVLDFLQTAQDEYSRITKTTYRFFTPLYIWDRWDSRQYGEPGTWTWEGPDPNTFWGGYQYRVIETVGKALYNDPTLTKAQVVLEDFFKSMERVWVNPKDSIPTNFMEDGKVYGEYDDPHAAALLMRAAIYAFESRAIDDNLCLRIINKCAISLKRTYAAPSTETDFNGESTLGTWNAHNSWYQFWGGEILHTIALLCRFTKNELFLKTDAGDMFIDTYPMWYEDILEYINIKTPVGVQKAQLVELNNEKATPLQVMTDKGVRAVLGGEKMSVYDLNLLKSNLGFASKTDTTNKAAKFLLQSQTGAVRIRGVLGQSLTNSSIRKTYDFSLDNWANNYAVQPNTTYTYFADVKGTETSVITKNEKDALGGESAWHDIDDSKVFKNGDTIVFSFTTGPTTETVMIYCQNFGADIQLDNIMLVNGKVESKMDYFTGSHDSCQDGLEITIRHSSGEYTNYFNLRDYVDGTAFPMRSNGDICDELTQTHIIKRIAADGSILDDARWIPLNKSLPLLECWEDSWIELKCEGILPKETKFLYPMEYETLINNIINQNSKIQAICGEADSGDILVGQNLKTRGGL